MHGKILKCTELLLYLIYQAVLSKPTNQYLEKIKIQIKVDIQQKQNVHYFM